MTKRFSFFIFLLLLSGTIHAQSRTWNSITMIPDSGRGSPLGSLTQNLLTFLADTNTQGLQYFTFRLGGGSVGNVLTLASGNKIAWGAGGGGGGDSAFINNQNSFVQGSPGDFHAQGLGQMDSGIWVTGNPSGGIYSGQAGSTVGTWSIAQGASVNVTNESAGFGSTVTSNGGASLAAGENVSATNDGSIALGGNASSSGSQSIALTGATVSGNQSLGFGDSAYSSYANTFVAGDGILATRDSANDDLDFRFNHFNFFTGSSLVPFQFRGDSITHGTDVIYPGGGGGGGSVTSVAMTVPSFLSIAGSPITTSGTLALSLSGTALPVANGGTDATTQAGALKNLTPDTTGLDLEVLTVIPGGGIGWDTITRGGGGGGGGVTTFSAGTTGLLPNSATSGAITLAGILGISNGGTGQTTANSALNALLPTQSGHSGDVLTSGGTNASWVTPSYFTSPMTTLGDIMYENGTPAAARLAGNTTATKKFLTQTGTGSVSAAPAWGVITSADIPVDSGAYIDNQKNVLQTASYRISGTGSVGASDTIGTDLILGHYLWNSVYLTTDINSFYIAGFNNIGIMNAVTANVGQVPICLGSNIFTAGHTGDSVFRGYKYINANYTLNASTNDYTDTVTSTVDMYGAITLTITAAIPGVELMVFADQNGVSKTIKVSGVHVHIIGLPGGLYSIPPTQGCGARLLGLTNNGTDSYWLLQPIAQP